MSSDPNDDATAAFDGKSSEPIQIPGYRIIRRLGHGGMGAVYLGEDTALGRSVAIKVVADAIARDPAVRARFLREARLLATVEHPNVVRVYSFGASEERAYLVMEYVEGETLADRIQRGPMAVRDACEIVTKVVDALDAAWEKRIIHRDIKPSNILFDRRGNLKVADFGLAKGGEAADTESSLTQTGYLLGSPHYVAPEQAQGHEADFRSDIYSLGVTLFEMLTGRKPFEGGSAMSVIARHLRDDLPSITSFRRDLGKNIADLVVWMTQRRPEGRPSSYRELLDGVRALDEATTAITVKTRRRPQAIGRRIAFFASGFCLISAIVLAAVFGWRGRTSRLQPPKDERLVVAISPFWGPDEESRNEGRSMAALVQQQIVTRLGSATRVVGIDETKESVRDPDSARVLGERLNATAVIWGQAFALHNEREIQPSITLVPRKPEGPLSAAAKWDVLPEMQSFNSELPSAPEAIRLQSQGTNQIEMRKTSAGGIGDLVTFLAATNALSHGDPQHALELLSQARRTADTLYQRAACFGQMRRDDDASRELNEALKLDPAHAQSLAMLADIDARALRFADAASHLRAAELTGRRFTSSEVALYNGTLYAKERYRSAKGLEDTATMLAIDPSSDRVLDRWELPGAPRVFSVDDSGITIRCDIGPPRSGELTTLHFVKNHFEGPPLAHALVLGRIQRMKAAWSIPTNFMREMGAPGLKLARGRFVYSAIDADPISPKTLLELKTALLSAVERDPGQPWHRLFLAVTIWELADHNLANRVIDQLFAQQNRGTAYYEFSWMAKNVEFIGHHDWADRLYAEALRRRLSEAQPIATISVIERMLDSPFVRRAAYSSVYAPNPPRDYLWLVRTREITGLSWVGDEIASAAWAHYFSERGDEKNARAEAGVHERAREFFGGLRMALTIEDLTRAAQIAIALAIAAVIVVAFFLRRSIASLAPNERTALILLAIVMIAMSSIQLAGASRAWLVDRVPVPMGDCLGHPIVVSTLDQSLTERDSDELRFITATAHHLAGETHQAADLYRTIASDDAAENLRNLDSTPPHMPDAKMAVTAFHRLRPDALAKTLGAAWEPRPSVDSVGAAYETSKVFYLTLLFAAAVLLFVRGAVDAAPAFPAVAVALFLFAAGFLGVAFAAHRAASARVKWPVSGNFSAGWVEPLNIAFPFPPDPTAEQAAIGAMARSEPMQLFWVAIAIAALTAAASGASLARHGYLRVRRRSDSIHDQPAEVDA